MLSLKSFLFLAILSAPAYASRSTPRISIELCAEKNAPLPPQVSVRTVRYAKAKPKANLASILHQWKVPQSTIDALSDASYKLVPSRFLKEGRTVKGTFEEDGKVLVALEVPLDEDRVLSLRRTGPKSFKGRVDEYPYELHSTRFSITIQSGLAVDGLKVGIPQEMLESLYEIFSAKLDLKTELAAGDKVQVLAEAQFLHGQFVKLGKMTAVQIQSSKGNWEAFQFGDQYYDLEGQALNPAIQAYPFEEVLVAAPFGQKRYSSKTGRYRYHKGVDLVAALGTPIRASGDGTILFIGYAGSFGRMVKIEHDSVYSTLYAHLHRYASGLSEGSVVRKGDIIGYVGQSGRATGPHLHYEIHRNGVSVNPMLETLPGSESIAEEKRAEFFKHVQSLQAMLSETNPKLDLLAQIP